MTSSLALARRMQYYRRVFSAYMTAQPSHLTFWHETPEINENARPGEFGEYYMTFAEKADYPGPFDSAGIPRLNYHGRIGTQYNPIAIAQYGLGNYNHFARSRNAGRRDKFLRCADWLVANLEPNSAGVPMWHHRFDWEYRDTLRAPWYSGLAQGHGISLLLRAHLVTGNSAYLNAARGAFHAFTHEVKDGGVIFVDAEGHKWIEEYIVDPPTHILNGFIWAVWGVYDYALATGEQPAKELFAAAVTTLVGNLPRYDAGYWSLYEQAGMRLPMLASPFYHRLHIVQLRVMHRLTGEPVFQQCAERWAGYLRQRSSRLRALIYKSAFKLCYY
jgi:heparosan-N-sulfate-glucuronate 5-epimerase